MSLRSVFHGLAFTLALFLPAGARAEAPRSECFAQHAPIRALPYETEKWVGQGRNSVLAGARVFFWAEPGLTKEWLQYQLAQRVAARRATSSCPLDVSGVAISVVSAGPGFWLEIHARETSDAKEVVRRAQALIPG